MTKIAVVILNWNGKKDTVACLKSINIQIGSDYQVLPVVVDNASSDGSSKEFAHLDIKNLHVIQNKINFGFAKGNNIGIKYAMDKGADYVMVLNNDTVVGDETLGKLVRYMEQNPKIAVCSPKIYFAKGYEFHKSRYTSSQLGKVIWYAGGVIDWKNVYGKNFGVDEVDEGQFGKNTTTDFATGACSVFRVKAVKETGLYDERYFMYLEDVDLSCRLKEKGWGVNYCGRAHIWHKVAQSSGIGSDLNDYYISRNRLLFGFKYAAPRVKVVLFKEAVKFLLVGRKWQKIGVRDYFLGKFGHGSWKGV